MLDAPTEKALAQLTEQARAVFGDDLISLTLYGSAAGEDFVAGRSDLNLAIVVHRLGHAHLKALHDHLPRWHKLGAGTPLLVDRHFLERARDVFAMELEDIKAQHRVLFGEEVFANLPIDARNLRFQLELEARGKLLRLRVLYAELGSKRSDLEALLLDSVKSFLVIMRHFVRLQNGPCPTSYLQILDAFEAHTGVLFPMMRALVGVKLGSAPWSGDAEDIFRTYLDEVERLIDLIDRFVSHRAAAQ